MNNSENGIFLPNNVNKVIYAPHATVLFEALVRAAGGRIGNPDVRKDGKVTTFRNEPLTIVHYAPKTEEWEDITYPNAMSLREFTVGIANEVSYIEGPNGPVKRYHAEVDTTLRYEFVFAPLAFAIISSIRIYQENIEFFMAPRGY